MFETLPLTRRSDSDPISPLLLGLAVAIHAFLAGAAMLSTLLRVDPIPLPRREIQLILPLPLPRPGAPAPLRGGGGRAADPKTGIRAPEPEVVEPIRQPPETPAEIRPVETEPPSPPGDPRPGDSEAPAGPGEPGGSPRGVPGGRGNCLLDCDPEGPVTDSPYGIRGGTEETGELVLPGIGGVTEPAILESTRVLPTYPELARRARITGQVILQAVIETEGSVSSIRILRETPERVGFGEAAATAVSRWRYRPGMQHGRPVRVLLTVTVDFTLAR
jgi:protein TonB